MVSIITDKLQRQALDDDAVDARTPQVEPLREVTTASRNLTQLQFSNGGSYDRPASEESDPQPDIIGRCHESSAPDFSRDREEDLALTSDMAPGAPTRCQLCSPSTKVQRVPSKKRQSHVMLSPDENDGSQWRPDWQATSIWRPVGLRNPAATKMAVAMPTGENFCSSECDNRTPRRPSSSSESPSPVLRPASASSGFFENLVGLSCVASQYIGSTLSPSLNLSAFSLTGLSSDDRRRSVTCCVPGSAGSMPAIGGDDSGSSSLVLGQPQRCHSQPSVLLEQRCVKKRRREERRPNLNFIKMKETAYSKRHQSHSRARSHVQFVENSNFLQVAKLDSGNQSRFFYSLDTIASSPQELASCQALVSPTGVAASRLQSASDNDLGESGACRESLDSGCSWDSVPCFGSESPSDFEERKKQLNEGIEEEEEVFDPDIQDDLDIEEIEKD